MITSLNRYSPNELLDYFAAHTHIDTADALKSLEAQGNSNPTVSEVAGVKARMRYLEAAAMLQTREQFSV
jgi:hypothetical protein